MYLKSRYVQIRGLELELATDLPPTGEIGDGRFLPKLAYRLWLWRQARRQKKLADLKFMIIHDFEDLKRKPDK